MISTPAIALYLGETYATLGLFDLSSKNPTTPLFEKSVFLPQTSFKNLINLTKPAILNIFGEAHTHPQIFIVTKYLDRLRQFRLGGSISQIILKGFENSYTLDNSKSLSLAAAGLIIALDPDQINTQVLTEELERIKKINPDLNKVVIAIPEEKITAEQMQTVQQFFLTAGLKVFNCTQPSHQNQLRKTLLNAGTEGTKEEIITDLKEAFGENTQVSFFCKNNFETEFENSELFTSFTNFLAHYLICEKVSEGAYFDIESLKYINLTTVNTLPSHWGQIPIEHYNQVNLGTHPFSEIKLGSIGHLQIQGNHQQLEPGPVIAGRAIKPLLLDLFFEEFSTNKLGQSLFTQASQESLIQKIKNLFSVLEKSQKNTITDLTISDLKINFLNSLQNEVSFHAKETKILLFGPLASLFFKDAACLKNEFSWPIEIIKVYLKINPLVKNKAKASK